METYTVAACQVNCGPASTPATNARKIIDCLRQTASAGARLALFPELSLSGYSTDEVDILSKATATTPAILSSACQAAQDLNVDLAQSWLIGDTTTDLQTAKNAGLRSILVQTGYAGKDGKYGAQPDHISPTLQEAVRLILDQDPLRRNRPL